MKKSVVIGIDIGGSTTKIVGFDTSGGEPSLIDPIFVRATDPITSVYGAFGKFLDINTLTLKDITKVMVTGAGSSFLTKPIYELECVNIPEFSSIGLGGLYLSGLDSAVITSCGTGTALVYAESVEQRRKPARLRRFDGGDGIRRAWCRARA